MVAITTILVRILTSSERDAGTDGNVYIGLCGREFYIDSRENDFERGSDRTYILGAELKRPGDKKYPVSDPKHNDPRHPQLDTEDVEKFPVYLRFELGEHHHKPRWNLAYVEVKVNPSQGDEIYGPGERVFFSSWNPDEPLWLGDKHGKFVYLEKGILI